ncbi:MAG: 16S rRNA processing protein RimM [Desulfuromonas sp.]|nr:16S rRNA processing protein RimM [Desulfuromonas sp.]
MNTTENQLFHVGTIIGTHGLRGDLKIRPQTSGSQALLDASTIELQCSDGRKLTADVVKASMHKQMVLLLLKGYDHINKVEGLTGAEVYMALDELADLEEDSLYWHQLEGLQVIDRQQGDIGVLSSILETGGHDVYITRSSRGEVMFPAVDAFIEEIDLERGVMRVNLPDGLIELNG